MTACHFIADRDLTLLCDIAANKHINARCKLLALITGKYLNVNDDTSFTVRNFKGVITNFSCLFAENSTEKSFFCCKLSFTLRCYLTNEDITCADFSTDTNDSAVVKILESVIADIRNVTGDLFGSELCISCFDLIFFDMDRSVHIFTNNTFIKENGVFVVVAFPCHEADEGILTNGNFTVAGCRTVSENLTNVNFFTAVNDRTLIYASALIGTLELDEFVGVGCACTVLNNDLIGGNLFYNTVMLGNNADTRINGSLVFHTCTNDRSFRFKKRNCLTLHV